MTKFMLGVAVGYLFSDIIDELIGKATDGSRASKPQGTSTTATPDPGEVQS